MFQMLRSAVTPAAPANRITVQDAIAKSKTDEVVVIDVRDISEIKASGMADGAVHVPLATLQMKADPSSPECLDVFKSGKPVAVYCAAGGRAGMAAQTLQGFGYDAHNIGGFGHWAQAGGPVRR